MIFTFLHVFFSTVFAQWLSMVIIRSDHFKQNLKLPYLQFQVSRLFLLAPAKTQFQVKLKVESSLKKARTW